MDTTLFWLIIAIAYLFLAIITYFASKSWGEEVEKINNIYRYYLDETNQKDDRGVFEALDTYFNRTFYVGLAVFAVATFLALIESGIIGIFN